MAFTQTSSPFAQPSSINRRPEKLPSQLPNDSAGQPLFLSDTRININASSRTTQETLGDSIERPFINPPNSTLPLMENPSKSREIFMSSSSARPSIIDGVLDIALHHAKDIHNICIYGNQDVYAKFSITHTQDAVYSTQAVRGGGKNPVFNQSLQIMISKMDAVLKCEIWMMSCVRTYLEDQLLGFVLIPLCDLFGQGRVVKDYTLSSTDLLHTPAGFVCLSLTFYLRGADIPLYAALSNMPSVRMQNGLDNVEETGFPEVSGNETFATITDNSHDMVRNSNQGITPMEYNSIEFPDLHDACETHQLVSAYLNMASGMDTNMDEDACGKADQRMRVNERDFSGASFLQLGSSPMTEDDSEMGTPTNGKQKPHDGPWSPPRNSVLQEDVNVISSRGTPTHLKAEEVQFLDSASTLSVEVPSHSAQESSNSQAISSPTSTMLGGGPSLLPVVSSWNGQESQSSFSASRVTISLEPEEPVMQQQIVDMYMKSMQQFTESLGKMKLPLDLDSACSEVEANNELRAKKEEPAAEPTNKDGHRVFYGSRAFF